MQWPTQPPHYEDRTPDWMRRRDRSRVTRVVKFADGEIEEMDLIKVDGHWCLATGEREAPLAIPGAREITVDEMVAGRTREVERYGHWIEVGRDVAHGHPDLLGWCRRVCNIELPKGGFRFAPKEWERHKSESLPLPFLPEFDHPDPIIRDLALVERLRRLAERDSDYFRLERDELIRKASARHSRRTLGRLLGISAGRVQQVTDS